MHTAEKEDSFASLYAAPADHRVHMQTITHDCNSWSSIRSCVAVRLRQNNLYLRSWRELTFETPTPTGRRLNALLPNNIRMKVYYTYFSSLYNRAESTILSRSLQLFLMTFLKSSDTPYPPSTSQFSSHLIYFVCYANSVSRPINQFISRGEVGT